MATLFVDKIDPQSGTALEIGSSGDTITTATGAKPSFLYPAFEAFANTGVNVSDNTNTKVQVNTEVFDSDSCYDNSTNYRFTPNKAGKYYVYSSIRGDAQADSNLQYHTVQIYKNGSAVGKQIQNFQANYPRVMSQPITYVVDMNGSTDYLEIYYLFNDTSGNPIINGDASPAETFFGAYRIGA